MHLVESRFPFPVFQPELGVDLPFAFVISHTI